MDLEKVERFIAGDSVAPEHAVYASSRVELPFELLGGIKVDLDELRYSTAPKNPEAPPKVDKHSSGHFLDDSF